MFFGHHLLTHEACDPGEVVAICFSVSGAGRRKVFVLMQQTCVRVNGIRVHLFVVVLVG